MRFFAPSRLCDSTRALPTADEWIEAELLAEGFAGGPLKHPPEEGVMVMTERLDYLKRQLLALPPNCSAKVLSSLTQETAKTRELLNHYQSQLKMSAAA